MNVRFEGGPFDGEELAIFGRLPEYLLLIEGARVGWARQARYELAFVEGEAVYHSVG